MLNKKIHKSIKEMFILKNNWKNILYIHTPFCYQKCDYCVYKSYIYNKKKYNKYLNNLLEELKYYKYLLKNIEIDEVYFGGGTPSTHSLKSLKKIISNIPQFKNIKLKSIEIHPATINTKYIEYLTKKGFNYISLGVQTLNKPILKKQNRIPISFRKLKHLSKQIMSNKDITLNIDLIAFLNKDKKIEEGLNILRKDINQILSISPSSFVVHNNFKQKNNYRKEKKLQKTLYNKFLGTKYKPTNFSYNEEAIKFSLKNFGIEYRLMKEHLNIDRWLMGTYAGIPNYGYNVLGLGNYNKIYPLSFFYITKFFLGNKEIRRLKLDYKILKNKKKLEKKGTDFYFQPW